MSKTFTADIDRWVAASRRRMRAVLRQSANDVMAQASQTAAGVTRGGSVRKGFVPVDTGFLANSLVSSLYGSSAMTTQGDYALVAGSMVPGDIATFRWTAEYARAQHYGYRTSTGKFVGGWLWVDQAAQKWPGIVARNAARARAIR